jgi:hypothetical protein
MMDMPMYTEDVYTTKTDQAQQFLVNPPGIKIYQLFLSYCMCTDELTQQTGQFEEIFCRI